MVTYILTVGRLPAQTTDKYLPAGEMDIPSKVGTITVLLKRPTD